MAVLAENCTFDTINGPFPSDGLFVYSDRSKVKTPFDPGEETGIDKPHSSPVMFGVSTSRRNPVFSAQELGAQHRAIFVPDMARSLVGIAKSVMIPALAAQEST